MLKIKWHEEVRLTKGYIRTCVYDLPRNNYIFIPNSINLLIKQLEGKNICLAEKLKNDEKDWFDIFEKNEYFFRVNEILYQYFQPLSLEWDFPALISNVIIDIDFKNDFEVPIKLIENIGCKQVAFRFAGILKKDQIYNFFRNNFSVSSIQSIDIYINKTNELKNSDFTDLCTKYPLINNIYLMGSKIRKKMIRLSPISSIIYLTDKNNDQFMPNFNVNISLYTESQKHNTYFNRKLYIGFNGEIKNAPECCEIHGNIQDITNEEELKLIINKPEFQKYWFAYKDIVNVCKECEFRHMCVDSRIPYPSGNGTWYHKTECSYNPYIAKWQGEEGYDTVEECGTYTKEKDFVVNKRKVNKLNKEIWGE